MIVVYNLATLVVEHCVHASGPGYRAFLESDPERGCVEMDGAPRPDEIGVEIVDGGPRAFLRTPFAFDAPSSGTAGALVTIAGVPEGTAISGDGGSCVMDAGGLLELTFETPGAYHLAFTHPRFLRREHSLAIAAD